MIALFNKVICLINDLQETSYHVEYDKYMYILRVSQLELPTSKKPKKSNSILILLFCVIMLH